MSREQQVGITTDMLACAFCPDGGLCAPAAVAVLMNTIKLRAIDHDVKLSKKRSYFIAQVECSDSPFRGRDSGVATGLSGLMSDVCKSSNAGVIERPHMRRRTAFEQREGTKSRRELRRVHGNTYLKKKGRPVLFHRTKSRKTRLPLSRCGAVVALLNLMSFRVAKTEAVITAWLGVGGDREERLDRAYHSRSYGIEDCLPQSLDF